VVRAVLNADWPVRKCCDEAQHPDVAADQAVSGYAQYKAESLVQYDMTYESCTDTESSLHAAHCTYALHARTCWFHAQVCRVFTGGRRAIGLRRSIATLIVEIGGR
jgi:hypothetical protein